jgi:hypothetical protein
MRRRQAGVALENASGRATNRGGQANQCRTAEHHRDLVSKSAASAQPANRMEARYLRIDD